MYNRLDTIPACDRQTDRRTDGRTDILPRHSLRYAYASCGKNDKIQLQQFLPTSWSASWDIVTIHCQFPIYVYIYNVCVHLHIHTQRRWQTCEHTRNLRHEALDSPHHNTGMWILHPLHNRFHLTHIMAIIIFHLFTKGTYNCTTN